MVLGVLTAALLTVTAAAHPQDSIALHQDSVVLQQEEPRIEQVQQSDDNGYWKRRKYNRISFNTNHFSMLSSSSEIPLKLALGWDKGRNIWLHKKPIAGMIKFGLDLGVDLNYMWMDLQADHSDYEGPSGYMGSEPIEDNEDMALLADLSGHHLSLGLAVGPSVTINPVSKVRICGYAHFVPSASFFVQGMSMNLGYSLIMKYGLEAGFGAIGVGLEYNHGLNTYTDMINYITVKGNGGDVSDLYKARYYLESLQVYLSFRFGKK